MELLKTIKDEWGVVVHAPLSFLALAVVMFSFAYFVAKWRYSAIVEQVKAVNDALNERLHLRSEQTESFRDKAAKYDEKLAEVVDSGRLELRDKTLKLVADLREFITRFKQQDQAIQDAEWYERGHVSDDDERRWLWDRFGSSLVRVTHERNGEYDRRFRVEAMMLRDELRSRLPDYVASPEKDRVYEFPTNYFGFSAVADDLELMAKSI